MSSDSPLDPVAIDFLTRLLADRENGERRSLASYLSLYPGHEETVAREYLGSAGEDPATAGPLSEEAAADRLGPYRIERVLGKGGQSTVYLALDTRLSRKVALKVLSSVDTGCGKAMARLRREAELASRLDHPAICTVYEIGVHGSSAFIAMRLVEGASLAARLRAERERGAAGARITAQVRIAALVARALHAAHEIGVIHRDIKPGNIMITPRGEPVVLDFGVARDAREDVVPLTQAGAAPGTPAYMSPEQISGGVVDRRSDVWSLGVVLYEALTLRLPFEAPTHIALAKAVVEREPPDLRRLEPHVSRDLAAVVAGALAKETAHRYQTAADLAADLERVLDGHPVAIRPASATERLWRWSRRRPAAAALALLLLVGVPVVTGLIGFLAASWADLQKGALQSRLDRIEPHLERGFMALEGGTTKEALAAFAAALREDPDCVEALAGEALAHRESGDAVKALEVLAVSRDVAQRNAALQRVRAQLLRQVGRDAEAERIEARLGAPRDALEFFVLGFRDLVEADKAPTWDDACRDGHRRALEQFTQATDRSRTTRPLYWYLRAFAAGRCQDEKAARASASVLALHWPRCAAARSHAGFALVYVDPASAARHFEAAIELRPDDPATRSGLGDAMHQLGRAEAAIAAYREALRLAPDRYESNLNLAAELCDLGRVDEAAAELERMQQQAPRSVAVVFNLANARERQGRQQEALDLYGKALSMDPACAPAWEGAGTILARLGRTDEALVHLREAVRRDPRQVRAWLSLGNCLRVGGDLDHAIAAFRRVVELEPTLWEAVESLVDCLVENDDPGEAVAACAKIVAAARPGDTGPGAVAAACAALTAIHVGELVRETEGTATRPARGAASFSDADLRGRALGWLSGEVEHWRTALRSAAADKARARDALRSLGGKQPLRALIRQLDALPEDERQSWRDFWAALTALLRETD